MLKITCHLLYLFTKKKKMSFVVLGKLLEVPEFEQKGAKGQLDLNNEQVTTWITWLEKQLNIAHIAPKLAYFSDLSMVGMVGSISQVCQTVGEASRMTAQWAKVNNPFFDIDIEENEQRVTIKYLMKDEATENALLTERILLTFMTSAYLTTGKLIIEGSYPLDKVTIAYPAPADVSYFEKIFGITPVFGAVQNSFVFARKWFDAPVISYNKEVFDLLKNHMSAQLIIPEEDKPEKSFSQIVKNDIITSFKALRNIGIADIADIHALSKRGVQRKLKEENATFRQLHEVAREELAIAFLKNDNISIKEIAYLLGYSGASAFSKAFAKWQGLPPKEFRIQVSG